MPGPPSSRVRILVLELPVSIALGSAPVFASGAVAHLNRLNCIDYLCFGCETDGDSGRHLQLLEQAADILIHEPAPFREHLTDGLKSGLSYPAARERQLKALMDVPPLLTQPNNILALEYVWCPEGLRFLHSSGYSSEKGRRLSQVPFKKGTFYPPRPSGAVSILPKTFII